MEKNIQQGAKSMNRPQHHQRKCANCQMGKEYIQARNSTPADIKCFKKCAKCGYIWSSPDLYLSDPELRIVGYQANFDSLELGTFMFNHSCGTTMSILAKEFVDLYTGYIHKNRATGSRKCPKYCFCQDELKPCTVKCECAYIRKVGFIIQHWPKVKVDHLLTNLNIS
jgi:hypothetical protein